MKLARRQFLHLAAGAAALPGVSRIVYRRVIHRGRYALSWALPPRAFPTFSPG
jgi:hypothetical protein